jgi:hypothetical protein
MMPYQHFYLPLRTTMSRNPPLPQERATTPGLGGTAWAITVVVAASLGAGTVAASVQPEGPAETLNSTPPCSQLAPDVASRPLGGFVAVWAGEVEGGVGIGGRLLDDRGRPTGEELVLRRVSPPVTLAGVPKVARAFAGGFVVAWSEVSEAPLEIRLLLQAFDRDGTPRGPAVQVATSSPTQAFSHALATDIGGRPAVVWTNEAFVWLRLFDVDLNPRSEPIEVALGGADPTLVAGRPAAATDPFQPELLVVWEEAPVNPPSSPSFDRIRGRLFDLDQGTALGPAFSIHQAAEGSRHSIAPAVASLYQIGYVVAWAGLVPEGRTFPSVQARILDRLGQPLDEPFEVEDVPRLDAHDADVAASFDGTFSVVWSAETLPPPGGPQVPGDFDEQVGRLRLFDPFGTPYGPSVELGPIESGRLQTGPAAALSLLERLAVVWREHSPPASPPSPCPAQAEIVGRAFTKTCANERRLCLGEDRFEVEVRFDDPRIGTALPRLGGATPLSDDTGTFWFFRPGNHELMVKVLDGREINDRFWLFSGALSDLGYEILVTDTFTRLQYRHRNEPGELASHADTRAFIPIIPPPAGGGARRPATAPASVSRPDPAAPPVREPAGPPAAIGDAPRPLGAGEPVCSDPLVLCLFGGRFAARVEWRDPRSGLTGAAVAEPLNDESGTFWFFRPGNRELILKILDGRSVNGYFWVFFGALTDLEYTVTVEDRLTDLIWSHENPAFRLTSHADTRALPDVPCPMCAGGGATTRTAKGDGVP